MKQLLFVCSATFIKDCVVANTLGTEQSATLAPWARCPKRDSKKSTPFAPRN